MPAAFDDKLRPRGVSPTELARFAPAATQAAYTPSGSMKPFSPMPRKTSYKT